MAYDLKVPGYGTLVKVDDDDSGSTFTTVGFVREVTPPPLERNTVDGTTLTDAYEVLNPGTEVATEFVFTIIDIINSVNHTIPFTLFTNKTDCLWQVVYPQGTPVTDQFSGWVKKIGKTVAGPNEYWMTEVTVQVTSTTTRS